VSDETLLLAGERSDWITHGRTYAEDRFSPLTEINDQTVSRLGLAWSFVLDTRRGLEATPLVVNSTMYFTGVFSVVYAVDARNGELLWKWDPEARAASWRSCCDAVNRGVAFYQGKVYVGTFDGRLAALDAATGEPVWQVQTTDATKPYTITGAPRVVKGKVIIGNGGAEFGVRGYVSAYDAEKGELVWRFYTVPGDPAEGFESPAIESAAETWNGEWWKLGGGGTVWDSMAFDQELDLLYIGTGNGSPWNQQVRSPGGGDNLYLCSILALRPDTGELVWHYQVNPGDTWDYTATQPIILSQLQIDGRERKVLMQAPKNGFFYVLDRETGDLISAENIIPVTWASGIDIETGRPIETPGARYLDEPFSVYPGPEGAHNWQPMSYHPETGLVYIPVQQRGLSYSHDEDFQPRAKGSNSGIKGGTPEGPPPDPPGFLLAWDPVHQTERWRAPHSYWSNGGTLASAGNLVFQGNSEGYFVAYRADSGEKLWQSEIGVGIIAAPITYQLDGRQYVSVLAGWGGIGGFVSEAPDSQGVTGRLLTYALDASEPIPAPVPRSYPPLTAIPIDAQPETIEAGAKLYGSNCAWCHGPQASSRGAITDLRRSHTGVFENYVDIVLGGQLLEVGMPAFEGQLIEEDVMAIRSYVLDRRAELMKAR